jgi:hypothetical protein
MGEKSEKSKKSGKSKKSRSLSFLALALSRFNPIHLELCALLYAANGVSHNA